MSFVPTFTPQQLDSLKKVAKAEKLKGTAQNVGMAIEVVGEVASTIITTVWAIRNEQERQFYLDQIQYLDEKQATDLEANLRVYKNQEARLKAFADFISKNVGAKLGGEIKSKIEQQNLGGVRGERKKILYVFGGILALLLGIVVIKKIIK